MQWDNAHAIKVIEQLNFPHKVGTPEHDKAADFVIGEFQLHASRVTKEEFTYSNAFKWLLRAGNCLVAALSIAIALVWESTVWAALLLTLLATGLLSLVFTKSTVIVMRLLNRSGPCKGTNIIADFPPTREKKMLMVLGAHYDTTSVNKAYTPIFIARVGAFLLLGIIVLIYGIIRLITTWTSLELFTIVIWALASAELSLTLLHLAFRRSNTNPGCVDNSSGVATLAEIARNLAESPLEYVHTRVIAFDCEEEGLLGSCAYVLKHRAELEGQRAWMISLDMVAGKLPPRLITRSGVPPARHGDFIAKRFSEVAPEAQIKPTWFPYWGSDHAPFYYAKLEQVTWLFTPSKGVHHADTLDKVQAKTLALSGECLLKILTNLDEQKKKELTGQK